MGEVFVIGKSCFFQKIKELWPAVVLGALLLALGYWLTGSWVWKGSKYVLAGCLLLALAAAAAKSCGQYFVAAALVFAVLFSPLAVKLLAGEALTGEAFYGYAAFCLCLAVLLLSMALLAGRCRFLRWVPALLLLPALLVAAVIWCYYFDAGALLATDTVLAIMQTNAGESREYLAEHVNFASAAAAVLLAFVYAFQARLLSRLELRERRLPACVLLAVAVLGSAALLSRQKHNFVTDIFYQTKVYTQKYQEFAKQREYRLQTAARKLELQEAAASGVWLLVLGESQNREHMQAYGYERPTTPWLAQMRADKNFLLFTNAYSCHTHTVPVLSYALTAKNQYNALDYKNAVTILEAAEAAGFATVWLSNQVRYGSWDTPTTTIAAEADQQFWLNSNVGETTSTNVFDGALADKLAKVKLSGKTLIVVHLMGNHGSYNARYPKEFAVFKGANNIDYYDNSMLYNDHVVQRLFSKARELPGFQGLIYCADHADAVRERLGHDSSRYVPAMTHIPFYMYFTDIYIQNNKEKFAALQRAQDKYFTNDLLFDTLLSVLGIRLTGVYEPQNDIAGSQYDGDKRRFKTLHGKKLIEER